jgi:hypothetical protein
MVEPRNTCGSHTENCDFDVHGTLQFEQAVFIVTLALLKPSKLTNRTLPKISKVAKHFPKVITN